MQNVPVARRISSNMSYYGYTQKFSWKNPESKAAGIIRLTSSSPLIIADNTVMVIFLTKNAQLRSELREILKNYEKKIQSVVKDPKKRHAITAFG